MSQLTIGTSVVPIANQGDDGLYLINRGPDELYYSKEPSLNLQNGTPLDAGNAVQWPAQQAIYVVSAGSSLVAYENNGSSVAIGATTATIAEPVTVSNPVTNPVVSGTVGNEPSNALVFYEQIYQTYSASGVSGATPGPTSMDLDGYSSIYIGVDPGGSILTAGTASNFIAITVYQYTADSIGNQIQIAVDRAEFLLMAGKGGNYFQVPVKGEFAVVIFQVVKSVNDGSSGTVTVTLCVSHETIETDRYEHYPSTPSIFTGDPGAGYANQVGGTGSQTWPVISKAGDATFHVLSAASTTTGSANLHMADAGVDRIFCGTGAMAAGAAMTILTHLPMRPIFMSANPTNTGSSGYYLGLMQD